MWTVIWLQVFVWVYGFALLLPVVYKLVSVNNEWAMLPFPVQLLWDTMLTTLVIDLFSMDLCVWACGLVGYL